MLVITNSYPSLSVMGKLGSDGCRLIRVKVLVSKHVSCLIHDLLRSSHILSLNMSCIPRLNGVLEFTWC